MSIKVRIPTQLRALVGGAGEVEVEGATVGDALKALDASYPGFRRAASSTRSGKPAPVSSTCSWGEEEHQVSSRAWVLPSPLVPWSRSCPPSRRPVAHFSP